MIKKCNKHVSKKVHLCGSLKGLKVFGWNEKTSNVPIRYFYGTLNNGCIGWCDQAVMEYFIKFRNN